jgi:hypothetical protein
MMMDWTAAGKATGDAEIVSSELNGAEAAAVKRIADIEDVEISATELSDADTEAVEREIALNEIDNGWDDIKVVPPVAKADQTAEIDAEWDNIKTAPAAAKADQTADIDAEWDNIADSAATNEADSFAKKIEMIKLDRSQALLERGEIFVPHLSETSDGSVRIAIENGFLRQCTTVTQMNRVEQLAKLKLSDMTEFTADEAGIYAKLSPAKHAEFLEALYSQEPAVEAVSAAGTLPEILNAVNASAISVSGIVPASIKKAA